MKNCIKLAIGLFMAALLVACGGGGGSAGGTTTGGTGTSQTATLVIDILGGSGASTNSITTVEIATARATLKDAKGAAVPNVIVTFNESAGSLLTFAPASKTALTDSNGVATVELRAATPNSLGATTVDASAQVGGVTLSSLKSLALASVPPGAGTDPQTLASALNFLDVNPADKSIVLAGSGGNGRSESATLRFRVVDQNNSPVKGVNVDFAVIPSTDVVLNIASAASDAEGVVVTTVSSKSVATAVVVRVVVRGRTTITSQSDQLLVTTGVATQAGFDLSASKYNLNRSLTGDSSVITVRIRDANGNQVADGVPVVFTADYGVVGSSSRGGCTTVGGACDVTYLVQDPRPPDGTLAKITASTRLGSGSAISDFLELQMSDPGSLGLFTASTGGTAVTEFDMTSPAKSCKQTFEVFVGTPAGAAAPAQTAVAVTSITTGLVTSIKTGTPILDARTLGRRTQLAIEVDASTIGCNAAGTGSSTARFNVKFTSGSIVGEISLNVKYPI